jgi:hypothetical protein
MNPLVGGIIALIVIGGAFVGMAWLILKLIDAARNREE